MVPICADRESEARSRPIKPRSIAERGNRVTLIFHHEWVDRIADKMAVPDPPGHGDVDFMDRWTHECLASLPRKRRCPTGDAFQRRDSSSPAIIPRDAAISAEAIG
jgi:hypothetical protein